VSYGELRNREGTGRVRLGTRVFTLPACARASCSALAASICIGIWSLPADAVRAQDAIGRGASQATTSETVVVRGAELQGEADGEPEALPRAALQLHEVLNGRAANLIVHSAGAGSFNDVYAIRGLANTPNFSKAAVTLYVDDVPTGSTFTNFPLTFSGSSTEVFRGPHAERFGKNSEAGVINVTIEPPTNEPAASASFRVGSYDLFAGELRAAGPLVRDGVFGSLSVTHLQRDGYLHNTFLDTHPDDFEQTAARLALRFTPANEWTIDLISELHHSDDGVQRYVPLASEDPFEVAFDFDGRTRIAGNVQAIKISREDEGGRWLSITSRRDWHLHPYQADFDYSPEPFVVGRFDLRQLQIAEELRYESAQLDRWRWRAGVFVDRVSTKGTEIYASPGYLERITFAEVQWEAALFGSATWQVADRLELTLGMRVEHVDDEIERERVTTFEEAAAFTAARAEWNAQPKLVLEYKQSDALTYYGSSAYGYKAGGFSFLQTDPRFASFDTERVWANELGVRAGNLKTRRYEARAAVFYNIVWDYQVERLAVFPDITIFNAPEVQSWGGEAEVRAELVRGWEVSAQLGYTRSEFARFRDPFTGASYAGNRTPFTPEFTAALTTRYTTGLGLFGEAALIAAGETFYDEANTAFLRQAPHAQVNAQVGYAAKHFSVALFGENLSDARYFTQKIGYAQIGTPAAPRTFGAMLSLKL
jgi:iron complex outermembrane recepter protein